MELSFVDLRRKTKQILEALERGETITLFYRGKKKGVIMPAQDRGKVPVMEHPAFGMWRDREDTADVDAFVRELRKNRIDDI